MYSSLKMDIIITFLVKDISSFCFTFWNIDMTYMTVMHDIV